MKFAYKLILIVAILIILVASAFFLLKPGTLPVPADSDNDGIPDEKDNCPGISNPEQKDSDGDGIGDECDKDSDNDGIPDEKDNCHGISNPTQDDSDKDGIGDECDDDIDNDGIINREDNCPGDYNPHQLDSEGDGNGDVCDINLFLGTFAFDPLKEKPDINESLLTTLETGYYVIQFNEGKEKNVINEINALGGSIPGYVNVNGLLVSVNATKETLQAIPGVRFVGIFQPAFKLDVDLYNKYVSGNLSNAEENIPLDVWVFNSIDSVKRQITGLGGTAEDTLFDKVLMVNISETMVDDIAFIPDVELIEIHYPDGPTLDVSTTIMDVRPAVGSFTIFGLDGAGQSVSFYDTGLDTGNVSTLHQDIRGRIINLSANWADNRYPNAGFRGHGTHVIGISIGNGSGSGATSIKGVAHRATGIIGPWDARGLIDHWKNASAQGATIHSVSWQFGPGTNYGGLERDTDNFLRNRQNMLNVIAAGNNGPGVNTIRSPSGAKNVLTVGSSENANPPGYAGPRPIAQRNNRHDISGFSSRGFAADGRVKPDVVAPGTAISSLRGNGPVVAGWCENSDTRNAQYEYCSGTSMATPHVSGMAALIKQYLINVRNFPDPTGMLVKAFIINGAQDMNDTAGNTNPIPNNLEGWGMVNLTNSIAPSERKTTVAFYDSISLFNFTANGQTKNFTNVRFSFNKQTTITLTWYDPPAAAATGAGRALRNDLDLELRSPSGKLFRGGANSFAAGQTTSGGAKDNLNTVEKLIRFVPEDGFYNITIRTPNPNGIVTSPQPFAIVASRIIGVDPINTTGNFTRAFTHKDNGIYARAIGQPNNTEVNVYVIKYGNITSAQFEDNNSDNLENIKVSYKTIKTDENGAINIAKFENGLAEKPENKNPAENKVWNSPSNYIYDDEEMLGDGRYNLVIDVGGDGNYNKKEDVVDYHNAIGFKVRAATAANSSGNVTKVFNGLCPGVFVKAGGLPNNTNVDIYVIEKEKSDIILPGIYFTKFDRTFSLDGLDVTGRVENVTTDSEGKINATSIWNCSSETLLPPMDDEKRYNIVIDLDRDGYYNASIDVVDRVKITALESYIGVLRSVDVNPNRTLTSREIQALSQGRDATIELQIFLKAWIVPGLKVTGEFDAPTKDAMNDYLDKKDIKKAVNFLEDIDMEILMNIWNDADTSFLIEPANWTVMVYMATEDNLEKQAFEDINEMEMVGSNENITILVQVDWTSRNDGNISRYCIKKDDNPEEINSSCCKSMNDSFISSPENLADFVNWTTKIAPAKHYILILWSNGDGWKSNPEVPNGLLQDFYPENDVMDMSELKKAVDKMPELLNVSKLDILAFDAPLMASIEVAYQVKDGAYIMVASQGTNITKDRVPPMKKDSVDWNYTDVLERLANNTNQTPKNYSMQIVRHAASNPGVDTLSAINLSGIPELVTGINGLADPDDLRGRIVPKNPPEKCPPFPLPDRKGIFDYNKPDDYKDNVQTGVLDSRRTSRTKVQTFGGIIDFDIQKYAYDLDETPEGNKLKELRKKLGEDPVWGDMDFIDIYHFAELLKKDFRIDNSYKDNAQPIIDLLKKDGKVVIDEYHSEKFPDAHGMSIYFPYQQKRSKDDPIHEYSYDAPQNLSKIIYHLTPGLLFPTNEGAIWWKDDTDIEHGRMLKRYYTPVADAETDEGKIKKVVVPSCLEVSVPVGFSGVGSSGSDFEGFAGFGRKLQSKYEWLFGDGEGCMELWNDKPAAGNNDGQPQPSEITNTCDKVFDGKSEHTYKKCGCFVVTLVVTDDDGKNDMDWVYVWIGDDPSRIPVTPQDNETPPQDNLTTPEDNLTTPEDNLTITPRCGDGYLSTPDKPGGGNEECDMADNPAYSNWSGARAYPCPAGQKCVNCKCVPADESQHNECIGGACIPVNGPGENLCVSDIECYHYECIGMNCEIVKEPGESSCALDTD